MKKATTKKQSSIVILHGWGASSTSFQEIKELLEKEGFRVEIPDLPGFGDTPLMKDPMSFDDYVAFVENFVGERKVIMLAHSFGARVAIAFAANNPDRIVKLILVGASGIIHPLSMKKKLGLIVAKVVKVFLGDSSFGNFLRKINYMWLAQWDYYSSGKLKETFKNIYRVDIRELLPKIYSPTLLVWGENDLMIPVSDGEYMQEHIKNAKFITIKGAGHKLPYEMPHVFIEKILPFIQ